MRTVLLVLVNCILFIIFKSLYNDSLVFLAIGFLIIGVTNALVWELTKTKESKK